MSVASRKMTAYAKTDCVGASKGLFFGLLTLVLGVISLILFFVLINHENQQVNTYVNAVSCLLTFSNLSSGLWSLRNPLLFIQQVCL